MKPKNTDSQTASSSEYTVAVDRSNSFAQEHMMRITHAYLFGQDLCLLEPCSRAQPCFGTHCFDSAVHANSLMPNPWQRYQAASSSTWKENLVKEVWMSKETQHFILNDCFGPHISQDEHLLAAEYRNPFPQAMPISILRNAEEAIYCIRSSHLPHSKKLNFIREALSGSWNDATGLPPCYKSFLIARDTLPVEILLPFIRKEFELNDNSLQREFNLCSFGGPAFSLYQDPSKDRFMIEDEFLHIYHGDTPISHEISAWLNILKIEYRKIIESDWNILPASKFILLLLSTLESINRKLCGVYAFKDMLDDYLQNIESPEYQTAWSILYRFVRYEAKDFTTYDDPWVLTPPESGAYPTRQAIKYYLAVLANRELRRTVFGF